MSFNLLCSNLWIVVNGENYTMVSRPSVTWDYSLHEEHLMPFIMTSITLRIPSLVPPCCPDLSVHCLFNKDYSWAEDKEGRIVRTTELVPWPGSFAHEKTQTLAARANVSIAFSCVVEQKTHAPKPQPVRSPTPEAPLQTKPGSRRTLQIVSDFKELWTETPLPEPHIELIPQGTPRSDRSWRHPDRDLEDEELVASFGFKVGIVERTEREKVDVDEDDAGSLLPTGNTEGDAAGELCIGVPTNLVHQLKAKFSLVEPGQALFPTDGPPPIWDYVSRSDICISVVDVIMVIPPTIQFERRAFNLYFLVDITAFPPAIPELDVFAAFQIANPGPPDYRNNHICAPASAVEMTSFINSEGWLDFINSRSPQECAESSRLSTEDNLNLHYARDMVVAFCSRDQLTIKAAVRLWSSTHVGASFACGCFPHYPTR
ncbi:hypothetical protein C8F01DRAFT_1371030 [Mycena amicta]|nr:hypothetical protein C8F01DRAFT_1371030 [Mycena amicta]